MTCDIIVTRRRQGQDKTPAFYSTTTCLLPSLVQDSLYIPSGTGTTYLPSPPCLQCFTPACLTLLLHLYYCLLTALPCLATTTFPLPHTTSYTCKRPAPFIPLLIPTCCFMVYACLYTYLPGQEGRMGTIPYRLHTTSYLPARAAYLVPSLPACLHALIPYWANLKDRDRMGYLPATTWQWDGK